MRSIFNLRQSFFLINWVGLVLWVVPKVIAQSNCRTFWWYLAENLCDFFQYLSNNICVLYIGTFSVCENTFSKTCLSTRSSPIFIANSHWKQKRCWLSVEARNGFRDDIAHNVDTVHTWFCKKYWIGQKKLCQLKIKKNGIEDTIARSMFMERIHRLF